MTGWQDPAKVEALVDLDPAEAGLKGATVRATLWTAGSTASQQLIQLGIMVVLARLVIPREFGLVAMIAAFTGFARLFVDAGFGAALVQRRRLSTAHLSTAFWLNLGVGAGISALAGVTAPLVALFYGQSELKVLMPVAGLDFLLVSVRIVQLALLERQLMFRRIALIDNVSLLTAGGVAIGCAFAGLGVWSLIVFTLVSDGMDSVLLWGLSGWRPSRRFDRSALRDLWSFGGSLLGSNALNYWNRNGDDLLIGRFAGATALGLYSRAYSVLLQLMSVSYVVSRTLFPALSRLQDNPERVRRAYLRALGLVALLTFPIATGFYPIAGPLVLTLFGSRWAGAVPLFQILAVAAVAQVIATTTGVIFQSQGRTDWALRWQIFATATAVVAFGVGVHWGAKGVAVAVSARSVLLLYPAFAIPGKLIGMRFRDVVAAVWAVLLAALLSSAAAWGVGRSLAGEASGLQLVAEVAAAGVVYFSCVHFARIAAYRDLRELLSLTRSGRREAGQSLAQEVG